jgi:hypothetical protein
VSGASGERPAEEPAEPIGFRDVTAALHGAAFAGQRLDVARAEMHLEFGRDGHRPPLRLRCAGVSRLQWTCGAAPDSTSAGEHVATVGLERLGPAEPWRFYFGLGGGSELELACARCWWNDREIVGLGRSYRDPSYRDARQG